MFDVTGADASYRMVQRAILDVLPASSPLSDAGPSLELLPSAPDQPRITAASIIEGTAMRARRVLHEPRAAFAAFLDGTQKSRVAQYLAGGVPIVHATVAAVIRVRLNRRMTTWRRPVVRHGVYAPRRVLPAELWEALRDRIHAFDDRLDLVDTSEPEEGAPESDVSATATHPFSLLEQAVHRVQRERERAERALAEDWCAMETGALFIDGGISGSDAVAAAPCATGVVKSHRTLYADGDALRVVLALGCRERSSAFRIARSWRTPVASWYLRLRDPMGHDPMWGLVRVEIADPSRTGGDAARLGERADEVSAWVLAEATPLSLPDARWDKMAYGVRDCEEFLRAVC